MSYLDVTDALVRSLAGEVAPLVERATGWPLELERMGCRVVDKDRGYEEILLGRLRGAGVAVDEDAHRGLAERVLEYILESNLLASYQPAEQELLVVRENVDESNLDGLRVIVAHELVHRAQHLRHPELFESVDAAVRRLAGALSEGDVSMREAWERSRQARAIMTLLESHAHYVQEQLHRAHFPGAVVETHHGLAALLLHVLGGAKLSQYTDAVPQVAEAAQRGALDELYATSAGPG